jgi:thiol-disulfide isomerase/thioredoxin
LMLILNGFHGRYRFAWMHCAGGIVKWQKICAQYILQPVKKLCIILLFCAAGCAKKPGETSTNTTAERTVGDIRLYELSDKPVDPDQFKGKIVFVNVWATWCAPCIKEMPSINLVKRKLADEGIEFLFASNESIETIEEFARESQFDIRFVHLQNFEEMNIPALPTTFIFDADGNLAYSESGFRQWDDSASVELIKRIAANR